MGPPDFFGLHLVGGGDTFTNFVNYNDTIPPPLAYSHFASIKHTLYSARARVARIPKDLSSCRLSFFALLER